jgi:crotonobetainyl-CoA:carnitine CoA-transferase CaiB-like acyl-CoA transferase
MKEKPIVKLKKESRTRQKVELFGPLQGLRIIDFSSALSGPFCTMLLADLGAEVIKVEPPEGDPIRNFGPKLDDDRSLFFALRHRNKKSFRLDLKDPRGLEVALRLIQTGDVLLENFRPGVIQRLGLGYEGLRDKYPRLIYCSISGFGQSGPYRDVGGYDVVVQAMSGSMSLVGQEGDPPTGTGFNLSDMATALYAVIAIQSAVIRRQQSGEGQYIEVSLLDSTLALFMGEIAWYALTGKLPPRMGAGNPSAAPWGVFRVADGYIALATVFQRQWEQLAKVLGREDLIRDPRFATTQERCKNRADLQSALEGTLQKESAEFWFQKITAQGIPASPVNTLDRVLADRHIQERKAIVKVEVGNTSIQAPAIPIRFSKTPGAIRTLGPKLGEHTRDILQSLNLGEEEMRSLLEAGVVR